MTEAGINALNAGQARLLIFIRVYYQDPLGRSYQLPCCWMYNKDVLGNLIVCPDNITLK